MFITYRSDGRRTNRTKQTRETFAAVQSNKTINESTTDLYKHKLVNPPPTKFDPRNTHTHTHTHTYAHVTYTYVI